MIHSIKTYFKISKHIALLCALCLLPIFTQAQGGAPIFLENSESLSFDQNANADCQVLRGNVIFRHGNTRLFCDLAYFYEQINKIDAVGNIRIIQGDSLKIYGDILHYNGNTRMAQIRQRVRVVSRSAVLTTDSLDYDQANSIGYYYHGGKIVDKESVLTSRKGEFGFKSDITVFKENVKLDGKSFNLRAESLKFNNKTKTAIFISPTNMLYDGVTKIYTEDGWYNTRSEDAKLIKNAYVDHGDGKRLMADTILFNKRTGIATARSHVRLRDSIQKMTVCGRYGTFKQNGKYGIMRDSAYAIEHSSKDSLYLHADTLRTEGDSTFQKVRAIGNVRFYRIDLQGKCDSLAYSTRDSILNMYEKPVIWSDSAQLCGEFMQVFQKNKKADNVLVTGWALGIIQVDSARFNQIEGKSLKAYIRNNVLSKIDVEGNAKTIYFPREDDGSIVGINKAESAKLTVHMKERKFDKIVMTPGSTGILYPEEQVDENDRYVKKFVWLEKYRPKNKADIFTRYAKEDDSKKAKRKKKKN